MLCSYEFSLAKPLSSKRSAQRGCPHSLFAPFKGTTGLSDFSSSCVMAVLSFWPRGPWRQAKANGETSRVPRKEFQYVHGVSDRAGFAAHLPYACSAMLPSITDEDLGIPEKKGFRGSIPSPYLPLSTLATTPRGETAMTRRAVWFATPSLQGTCTLNLLPAYRRFGQTHIISFNSRKS